MVGVPRSKGCSLCVKRRVKCDQTRPSCGNCVRYGADCPGFDKTRKFVNGKHRVRARRAHQGTRATVRYDTQINVFSTSDSDSDLVVSATQTFTPLTNRSALTRWAPNFSNYGGQGQTIPGALKEPCVPFVYNMMGQLFMIHSREEVVHNAPWFSTMLNYLGTTPVLDSAMCAFMLQLVGKAKGDAADVNRSRDIYGQSLGALQRALNHTVAWKSTETLAATILCSIFEMFAGTQDPLSWMLHVSGVSILIEQRGPSSFSQPIDRSLLRHARPMLVTKAIFAGHDCFLNEPKWRTLCEDLTLDTPPNRPKTSDLLNKGAPITTRCIDHYFILQSQLPPIIRVGYNVRQGRKHGIEPDPEQVARLRPKAEKLRAALLSWHDDYASDGALTDPIEVPSTDPTSPYKTVLEYRSPWEGSIHMSYWASLLIVQECLNQCHPGPGLLPFTDNLELAHSILRSLEFVGQGLMGPHRVGYPLRVAFDFVDVDTQVWTLSKVSRYNDTYAAMSADVYPSHPLLGEQSSSPVGRVESQPLSWID